MSFGFEQPLPIIDSNVRRVVQRVFGDVVGEKKTDNEVMRVLSGVIPKGSARLFNWSLLDIGATLCSYRYLKCTQCPLESICNYRSRV